MKTNHRFISLAATFVFVLATAGSTFAESSPQQAQVCGEELSQRIDFLHDRLEGDRKWANNWWRGFTSFYALGTVVTATQAAMEGDSGDRAVNIVGSVKAAFGTTRLLLWPSNAKEGADRMMAVPADDQEGCLRRAKMGESELKQNAKEADSRYSWKRHTANVAINVAGAGIADGFFDSGADAWIQAGVGIIVGEVMTWTHPRRASDDLDEYQGRFAPLAPTGLASVKWQVVPRVGGLGVLATF